MGVEIREYKVVYDALDDVRAMMASLIRPPPSKQLGALIGKLDVQQIFKIGAIGKVAGCKVVEGTIKVESRRALAPPLLSHFLLPLRPHHLGASYPFP